MLSLFVSRSLSSIKKETRPKLDNVNIPPYSYTERVTLNGLKKNTDINRRSYWCCSVTLKAAKFEQNYATDMSRWEYRCGGAIFLRQSTLLCDKNYVNSFNNNQAALKGGAVYAYDTYCEYFQINAWNNYAKYEGGAFYHDGMRYSRPIYTRDTGRNDFSCQYCVFGMNKADYRGGALAVKGSTGVEIAHNTFFQNSCHLGGGAIYFDYSDCNLHDNKFILNYASVSDHPLLYDSEAINPVFLPAGAVLVVSHPDGYPCWIDSKRNCYNANRVITANPLPEIYTFYDCSTAAGVGGNIKYICREIAECDNVLCIWSVHFKSESDKMQYNTANIYTKAIKQWAQKNLDIVAISQLAGQQLYSWDFQNTIADYNIISQHCTYNGMPAKPAPTPLPTQSPMPTKSPVPPPPSPKPTQTEIPTPNPSRTPIPDATPFPTEYVPTLAPTEYIPTPAATEYIPTPEPSAPVDTKVTIFTPAPTATTNNDNYTAPPTIEINKTVSSAIDISIGPKPDAHVTNNEAGQSGNTIIKTNDDKPDDSIAGLAIAVVSGVAAVALIAGVIYMLTKPSPAPMNLESVESVGDPNGNPSIENDNPIYSQDAIQDPFANEFEPV